MISESRVQRLVDEFEKAASFYEGYSVRAGIAARFPFFAISYWNLSDD